MSSIADKCAAVFYSKVCSGCPSTLPHHIDPMQDGFSAESMERASSVHGLYNR
jgi:hypothetical protein